MTEYPDSPCQVHLNVKTSEPVCVICMEKELEKLRTVLEQIADYPKNRSNEEIRKFAREALNF